MIRFSRLRLQPAPVVRQRNRLPCGVIEIRRRRVRGVVKLEFPAGIQDRVFAGEYTAGKKQGASQGKIFVHEVNHAKTRSGGKRNVVAATHPPNSNQAAPSAI